MEPLIHFKDADILNGESVVLYGLNMDIMPGWLRQNLHHPHGHRGKPSPER